jgi:hypothetical protein
VITDRQTGRARGFGFVEMPEGRCRGCHRRSEWQAISRRTVDRESRPPRSRARISAREWSDEDARPFAAQKNLVSPHESHNGGDSEQDDPAGRFGPTEL